MRVLIPGSWLWVGENDPKDDQSEPLADAFYGITVGDFGINVKGRVHRRGHDVAGESRYYVDIEPDGPVLDAMRDGILRELSVLVNPADRKCVLEEALRRLEREGR